MQIARQYARIAKGRPQQRRPHDQRQIDEQDQRELAPPVRAALSVRARKVEPEPLRVEGEEEHGQDDGDGH